jgi:hypothetical protein
VDAVSVTGVHLEFHHSPITRVEVEARQRDWLCVGVELVWVVDGGEGRVGVRHLPHCDTFLLSFHTPWLVDSFGSYAVVYVHVPEMDMVFAVCPGDVKSGMVDVRVGLTQDTFVRWVSGGCDGDPWDKRSIVSSTLYYNQRGAGCGKTYESVRLITADPRFAHKTQFLYVTKMHSGKDVIFAEFEAQLPGLGLGGVRHAHTKKQYATCFYRLASPETECSAVFGTIDSLFAALHTEEVFSRDVFMARVRLLQEQGVQGGEIRYAGTCVRVNRELLIIVDETQDLDKQYVEALTVVMRDTNADVYLIGDKLQSILTPDNAYTFLSSAELPHTVVDRSTPVNIVRRFHNRSLAAFVNSVVPFQKFGLPVISGICDGGCVHEQAHGEGVAVHWVAQPEHVGDEYEFVKDFLMPRVERVVRERVYLPHHLMFIEPLVKQSMIACVLHTELEALWVQLFQDVEFLASVAARHPGFVVTRERWVVWHKSEQGEPINLSESVQATRIVSIFAAKGDGRECVFALSMMDNTLHFLNTGDAPELKFESLVHVALTRAKEQLFVYTGTSHDTVYTRVEAAMKCLLGEGAHPEDAETFTVGFVVQPKVDVVKVALRSDDAFERTMSTFGLEEACQRVNAQVPRQQTALVDYEYHMLRYAVLDVMFMYATLCDRAGKRWMHLEVGLYVFAKARVDLHRSSKTFYAQLCKNWKFEPETKKQKAVPLRIFDHAEQRLYNRVAVVAEQMMTHLQGVVREHLRLGVFAPLCPVQALLLSYALNSFRSKHSYMTTSVLDMYYVLASQEHTYRTTAHSAQFGCQCDRLWSVSLNAPRNALTMHFGALRTVNAAFAAAKALVPEAERETLEWTRAKGVSFDGDSSFLVVEEVNYVARSASHLLLCVLAPQLTSVNTPELVTRFHHLQHMVALSSDTQLKERDVQCVIVTLNVEGGLVHVSLPPVQVMPYKLWLADACTAHVYRYAETLYNFYSGARERGRALKRNGFQQARAELARLFVEKKTGGFDLKPWLHVMEAKVQACGAADRAALVSREGFFVQFHAWVSETAAVFAGLHTAEEGDMEVDF